MELMIVYRILRKLSAWTIEGWYSDVYIDGAENVPRTVPLILTATHHNEIIDSAVLAATIPHGRRICFWAKSTMFQHPVPKFILESSGAIKVKRNPNRVDQNSSGFSSSEENNESSNGSHTTRGDLFKDTSHALAQGEVIGVFPEGTSYTLPGIAQVLPGAAWAAVEYLRSVREEKLSRLESEKERQIYLRGIGREGERTGLGVLPVGIVYEDKKRYMSRVCVGYGEPIDVDAYAGELFSESVSPEEAAKSVVKKLNAEIERRLFGLTVNAPNWETLYASRTAMKILWGDEERVHLETWVKVSQSLVRLFSSEPDTKLDQVRGSLVRYYALLYYTGIDHAILEEVLPLSPTSANLTYSLLWRTFSDLAAGFPIALIRFFAFVPALLFHVPGYILSQTLARALYTPGEEETEAQYRAVGGGFGIGLTVLGVLGWLWMKGLLGEGFGVKKIIGLGVVVYASMYVLVRWHLMFVRGNLRQLRRLTIFGKLVMGALFPGQLRLQELQMYSVPPPPPVNIFVKKDPSSSAQTAKHPPPISSHKLVQELLLARLQAHINLGNYMRNSDSKETTFLLSQGGRVPFVVA